MIGAGRQKVAGPSHIIIFEQCLASKGACTYFVGYRVDGKIVDQIMGLKVGDKAPAWSGKDQNGEVLSSEQFKGKKLVLYFYPRDNTPTCTDQACNLRDERAMLRQNGYEVVGVSADTSRKHTNFIKKYDLNFPLLADTELEVIKAFGVWGWKKFMGREYEGIIRTTFLIDEEGVIIKIINKVKAKQHTEQILEAEEA